jgi:outer membrane protein assembly factor BamB
MTAESTEGTTYWAVDATGGEPRCEITAVSGRLVRLENKFCVIANGKVYVGNGTVFSTEHEAVSYALERAERLAGYWERQTDQLRRRLHEIAVRGEDAKTLAELGIDMPEETSP